MKTGLILVLIATNLLCFTSAQLSFKRSALSTDTKDFLRWQITGNLAGFISVLSLTAVHRFIPLHLASAITVGLGLVLVQVIGSQFIFREPVGALGWTGAGLVVTGIVLISLEQRP